MLGPAGLQNYSLSRHIMPPGLQPVWCAGLTLPRTARLAPRLCVLPKRLKICVLAGQRACPFGAPVLRFSFRPPLSISRASAAGTTGCAPSSSANASRLIPAGRCSFSFGLGAGSAGPPPVRGTPRMSARRQWSSAYGLVVPRQHRSSLSDNRLNSTQVALEQGGSGSHQSCFCKNLLMRPVRLACSTKCWPSAHL